MRSMKTAELTKVMIWLPLRAAIFLVNWRFEAGLSAVAFGDSIASATPVCESAMAGQVGRTR